MGTGRKSRRSLRIALVMGTMVAGTALVGWGGLAAWSAYTENAGNSATAGTLSHACLLYTSPGDGDRQVQRWVEDRLQALASPPDQEAATGQARRHVAAQGLSLIHI